ncbi:hypothetical protein [Acetobacter sp.]|jgi:hypothetical protein|uniref:hypothetical protein n=1 Tax=Acetobacter sp. TaxID=440 RepID=UPI0025C1A88B|nr:hypothetical protein [Acetobacter sp.]MCH4091141.1 hypothetical protein [Acetobacter sp.]MCI1301265.1 hypothetical protein [Acetobacter sp.]MCI1317553.1 hypothetical protein [Acetobacter sp.]
MNGASVKNTVDRVASLVRRRPGWAVLVVAGLAGGWLLMPRDDPGRAAAEEVLAAVRA